MYFRIRIKGKFLPNGERQLSAKSSRSCLNNYLYFCEDQPLPEIWYTDPSGIC